MLFCSQICNETYKGSACCVRQSASSAERSVSLKGLYLPEFLPHNSLTECEPWLMYTGLMRVNTDDQAGPASNWLLVKKPGLVLATAWAGASRFVKKTAKTDFHQGGASQPRQTPGLHTDAGLWLVSCWYTWSLIGQNTHLTPGDIGPWVGCWDSDLRLSRDEMPQIRPEMTHYTPRPLSWDTGICSCVLSVYNWRKNAAQFQFKLKSPYNVTTGVWTFRNPSHIQNMQCIDKFSTFNIMSCVQRILGNDRHDLCPYWHSPWLGGW